MESSRRIIVPNRWFRKFQRIKDFHVCFPDPAATKVSVEVASFQTNLNSEANYELSPLASDSQKRPFPFVLLSPTKY